METTNEKTIQTLKEKYPDSLPTMVGVNGNAFALMGHFQKHARRAGWEKEDIDFVLDEARSGDYYNLVGTLATFTD